MGRSEANNDERPPDKVGVRSSWVVIAEVENRTLGEFAVNGLKSYDIPAVLDLRPGYLGTAGLQLRSMRTGKLETFKVMVPPEYQEEAAEVVKLFVGNEKNKGGRDAESMDEE